LYLFYLHVIVVEIWDWDTTASLSLHLVWINQVEHQQSSFTE